MNSKLDGEFNSSNTTGIRLPYIGEQEYLNFTRQRILSGRRGGTTTNHNIQGEHISMKL